MKYGLAMALLSTSTLALDENGIRYVPWDPSIFETGVQRLIDNVSAGINIGIWIFLMVIGLQLIFSFVRGWGQ